MRRKKLIVISLDALVFEDLAYLEKKPTFRYLLENGALVQRVRSIYPALTYPCHTTMATGCYPDKHGIINNTVVSREKNAPFLFEHKHVRCKDILDSCKKAGYTTAAVGWPVTGHHESVDYLVNECWPDRGNTPEDYKAAYLNNGTPTWLFEAAVEPYLGMRVGRKQPDSSYFLTNISAEIIRRYQPDILMLHQGNVDHCRHKYGVFPEQLSAQLDACEEMVGMLIDATKDAGVFEDTNFIVTADHGQLNVSQQVNLNCLFAANGFIETGKDVKSCKAWCQPAGMSGQIYLADEKDEGLYQQVYDLLCQKRDEGIWGISEVYTREMCQKMHLDGSFSFVVEADTGTYFGEDWQGAVITGGNLRGQHGYHPDKGPRPPLIACGPDIAAGVVLKDANLVDGAPTYAQIMGVALAGADGSPLTKLLKGEL